MIRDRIQISAQLIADGGVRRGTDVRLRRSRLAPTDARSVGLAFTVWRRAVKQAWRACWRFFAPRSSVTCA
ncbi:hypothetical protein [Sphingopyxis sp.]|uniref:hypothetical protein n=1 Tax=Sphingopyxis sp. TaxID=1908224 RepID=UPI001DFE3BAB|nr:hypothetical protein [Sphingopyxis sp.]